jgi:hypothetical protein
MIAVGNLELHKLLPKRMLQTHQRGKKQKKKKKKKKKKKLINNVSNKI